MPIFSYRDVIKRLKKLGFIFWREGKGSHEFWKHPISQKIVLLPKHNKNLKTGTIACISKQLGFTSLKDFEQF